MSEEQKNVDVDTNVDSQEEENPTDLKSTILLLRAYAKTYKRIDIGFEDFVIFVEKYVGQFGSRYKQLQIFEKNPEETLSTNLKNLEKRKQCQLTVEDSRIDRINFQKFLFAQLEKSYDDMQKNPDLPFPDENGIGMIIPNDLIVALDVQNAFATYLREDKRDDKAIIRITTIRRP